LGIIVFICLFLIIVGHWHWKSEIQKHSKTAQATDESIIDEKTVHYNDDPEEAAKTGQTADKTADIKKLTASLPDDVKNIIASAYDQHKTINMVMAGGKGIGGLAADLESRLNKAYGEGTFKVTEVNFADKTSLEVLRNELYLPIEKQSPDIVVFTSLLINDSGKVSTLDSATVPLSIRNKIIESHPNTVFMVEPPNPVTFNEVINERVDEVKTETSQAGVTYIDHFSKWPAGEALASDLDEEGINPNEQGLDFWADLLANYFTSKASEHIGPIG